MRIDEVKNHIGEEFVSERGSYSASLERGRRIRVEGIETVEKQRYSWSGRSSDTTRKRYVRVILLDNETGEPQREQSAVGPGEPITHLIEAKQIGAPWADYWEHTSAERARQDRERAAHRRLNRYLPRELWVGGGWHGWGMTTEAAEALADLLEEHVPRASDEEG